MMIMNHMWKSKDVSLMTKYRLVCTIVFPITRYGCESWTMKKIDRRELDSFELWRLLCIPWTAKITNKEVQKRVKSDMSLEGKITKLRSSYFGHVIRSTALEEDVMFGIVGGKR